VSAACRPVPAMRWRFFPSHVACARHGARRRGPRPRGRWSRARARTPLAAGGTARAAGAARALGSRERFLAMRFDAVVSTGPYRYGRHPFYLGGRSRCSGSPSPGVRRSSWRLLCCWQSHCSEWHEVGSGSSSRSSVASTRATGDGRRRFSSTGRPATQCPFVSEPDCFSASRRARDFCPPEQRPGRSTNGSAAAGSRSTAASSSRRSASPSMSGARDSHSRTSTWSRWRCPWAMPSGASGM
jgi:hypothetical protein